MRSSIQKGLQALLRLKADLQEPLLWQTRPQIIPKASYVQSW